jgi:hypothetical protein
LRKNDSQFAGYPVKEGLFKRFWAATKTNVYYSTLLKTIESLYIYVSTDYFGNAYFFWVRDDYSGMKYTKTREGQKSWCYTVQVGVQAV